MSWPTAAQIIPEARPTVEVGLLTDDFPVPGPPGPQGALGPPLTIHFGTSAPPGPNAVGDLWAEP